MTDLNGEESAVERPAADEAGEAAPAPAVEPVPCWRCGLTVGAGRVCPHCRAVVGSAVEPSAPIPRGDGGMPPLMKVILAFTGMLITALVWGWILFFGSRPTAEFVDTGTAALETLDAVLTLAVWAWIGRMRVPKPSLRVRILAWTAAPLALLLVMGVNSGYRVLVEHFVHGGRLKQIHEVPAWTLANILMTAVQPGIVEELFFRHLAFGAVRRVSGLHAAVWVSAVMFAVAHIYNPLGLPWLLLSGVVLGYFRAGGGLPLTMLMHFTHNMVVTWYWSS